MRNVGRTRGPEARSGFTLIEIMIVIVLLALASTGVSLAMGALTRSKLRQAAMHIVAASRFAYNHAVTHDQTLRVTFDLGRGTMSIEEAHGSVLLARVDDETRRRLDEDDDGAGENVAVDPWEAARQRIDQPIDPSFGRSPWEPLRGSDGAVNRRYQSQPLGDGIRVARILTPHDPAPREDGQAAVYFFPGGLTEHAIVQLMDGSGAVYTVEIESLTGRARVYDYAYEPETLEDEGPEDRR